MRLLSQQQNIRLMSWKVFQVKDRDTRTTSTDVSLVPFCQPWTYSVYYSVDHQFKYVIQIFQKTDISYPLIQRVRKISLSNILCASSKWVTLSVSSSSFEHRIACWLFRCHSFVTYTKNDEFCDSHQHLHPQKWTIEVLLKNNRIRKHVTNFITPHSTSM